MLKTSVNPCIRCGKDRVVTKTWQEVIGISSVTYTLAVCPDDACQKLVDASNAEREEKREFLAQKRDQSKLARKKKIAER